MNLVVSSQGVNHSNQSFPISYDSIWVAVVEEDAFLSDFEELFLEITLLFIIVFFLLKEVDALNCRSSICYITPIPQVFSWEILICSKNST